jgi:hypothetical protein
MVENNDGRRLTPAEQAVARAALIERYFDGVPTLSAVITTPYSNMRRVFDHLATERAYQKQRWGRRMEDGGLLEPQREPEAFLLYMQDYLTEAIHYVSRCPETPAAKEELMAMVRKIGALAVAAMEQHGSTPRVLQGVVNARDGEVADGAAAV